MWLWLTENSEIIRNLAVDAGIMLGVPFAIWRSVSAEEFSGDDVTADIDEILNFLFYAETGLGGGNG